METLEATPSDFFLLARKWGVGNRESGVGQRYFHSWLWDFPVGG